MSGSEKMEQEFIRKAVQSLKEEAPVPVDVVAGVLKYVEFLEGRINQLKAAGILGDAGMAVARAGIIRENEILEPYRKLSEANQAVHRWLLSVKKLDPEVEGLDAVILLTATFLPRHK